MIFEQIYSAEQAHGKIIEDQIKSTFPGASDYKRKQDSKFDVEAKFDKNNNLPTSIKTSKSNTICMADARRLWSVDYGEKLKRKFNCVSKNQIISLAISKKMVEL